MVLLGFCLGFDWVVVGFYGVLVVFFFFWSQRHVFVFFWWDFLDFQIDWVLMVFIQRVWYGFGHRETTYTTRFLVSREGSRPLREFIDSPPVKARVNWLLCTKKSQTEVQRGINVYRNS